MLRMHYPSFLRLNWEIQLSVRSKMHILFKISLPVLIMRVYAHAGLCVEVGVASWIMRSSIGSGFFKVNRIKSSHGLIITKTGHKLFKTLPIMAEFKM